MAFTRAQWEQLQSRLPVEDRMTFEEYLKSQGLTTAPATPLAAAEGGLIAAQSMESQTTGVTAPLTPSGPGKKPGKAWVLKDGNWAQPDKPIDDGLMEITDQRKLSNGKISQQTRTIVYQWNDSLGWRKRYTYERLVTDDPKAAEALEDAAKVAKEAAAAAAKAERDRKFAARPGRAWQWNEATTEWVQPKSPGEGYTWDDNFGWQLPKTPVSTSVTTTGVATSVSTTGVATSVSTTGVVTSVTTTGVVTSVTTTGVVTSAVTTKTYTREEWEAFQASLPPEDRMSYEDYLASLGISATTTGVVTSVTTTGVVTSVTTTGVVTSVTTTFDINRQSAVRALQDRFAKYGLASLANKILELAQMGATEATITLQLQETPEYIQRFSANQDRIKSGLTVLTPAEYLNLEDGYRQVLRAYGLRQFDNDAYVKQFIANDMSPAELSNRVVTAVQRVQNADPAITKQLRDFYGIGANDLVAYVLDPQQQFQKIERQVAAAEIGVAARLQGFETGVTVAEQLAAQGVTQAEARRGYSTIADILPTAEKLSQIYAGQEEGYGLEQAEQEVFNSLAESQRRRTRLTQREIAEFGGTSGVSRVGLTRQTRGQFQNP